MNVMIPIPLKRICNSVRDAITVTGGLSSPSKMPGKAWGLPAKHCKRGSKLHKIEGSVCHKCYARKGRYVFPNVIAAYERRWLAYRNRDREQWINAITYLINKQVKPDDPYFRVFDSGDLQDVEMLRRWLKISEALPHIRFWLVTRERGIVRRVLKARSAPDNLLIRVSGDMVGDEGPSGFTNIGRVQYEPDGAAWRALVETNTDERWYCPAPLQDNSCGDCRACWKQEVLDVIYRQH
jgi:hypothetical protein